MLYSLIIFNNMGQKCFEQKNRVDLTPEFIQKMMEENSKMTDEIVKLKEENEQYKKCNSNLLSENNQLKIACGQYQLMLLNQMNNPNQNILNNNNFINNDYKVWRNQINNLVYNNNNINNNNIFNNNNVKDNNFIAKNCNIINNQGNNMNNVNNNNFNSNNCNKAGNNMNNLINQIVNIIFKFEGGQKCSIVTFTTCKLADIFYLALMQIGNSEYSDIRQFKFSYSTHDISSHFLNNDEVKILKLPEFSIIEVIKYNNISC